MANKKELILLVENDPDISDVIARQALQPLGYRVMVIDDANKAIKAAIKFSPALVIADLNLSGLSGKDLLVAFKAQNFDFPVVILAEKGHERGLMKTLRLGAADYLIWPARSAEVIAIVEQGLKQTRATLARKELGQRLKESDQELAHKNRDLKAILNIGRAVASITDQRILFDKIVAGAMHLASADIGWLLLRDEKKKSSFLLAAQRNLPAVWAKKMNKPLDDGVSSLVALSGETLYIHGQPLKRFKIASLGKTATVVPIKAKSEVIGLLVVVRKEEKAITESEETLLETVGDYASISLVNANLFRALQQSAKTSQTGDKRQNAALETLQNSLSEELKTAYFSIRLLSEEKLGPLNKGQRQSLKTAQSALGRLQKIAKKILPIQK